MANGKKRLFNPFLENLEPAFCGSNICKMNHSTKTSLKELYFFGLFILLCLTKAEAQKKTNPREGNSVTKKLGQSDSAANFKNQYVIHFDVKNGNIKLPIVDNGKAKIKNPKVGQFIRIIFDSVPKYIQVGADALFFDKNLENAGTFQSFLSREEEKLNNEETKGGSSKENMIDSTDIKITEAKNAQEKITEKIKNELVSISKELGNTILQLDEIKEYKPTGNLIQAVDKNAIVIEKLAGELKIKDSTLSGNVDKILKEVKKIIEGEKITVNLVTNYKKSVSDKFIYDKGSLLNTQQTLVNLKGQYDSILNVAQKLINEKDSALNNLKSLTFDRHTEYIQPIQVDNRDFTQLAIRYTDTYGNTTAREITLKNKSGFKLDFSTGFIGTGLVDENYRVEPHPTSADTGIIRNDPKGKFAIGFAILSHAYFRTGRRVNFSLNAGLMLNGGNQTINYITGLSMPLGLEQRFVLSGGLAFGKIKTLTNGYVADGSYKSILNTGVPYTEAWRKSWYVGITYNISGLAGNSQAKVVRGSKE